MLDLCFFFRCDTDFPIFKWSIFLSCLFVHRYICLDQFSFSKVHVKIIEKLYEIKLMPKLVGRFITSKWLLNLVFYFILVLKSLVFKITREKVEVKKIAILFLCDIFSFSDVRSACLSHKTNLTLMNFLPVI